MEGWGDRQGHQRHTLSLQQFFFFLILHNIYIFYANEHLFHSVIHTHCQRHCLMFDLQLFLILFAVSVTGLYNLKPNSVSLLYWNCTKLWTQNPGVYRTVTIVYRYNCSKVPKDCVKLLNCTLIEQYFKALLRVVVSHM